ncbi:MAG: hypothetical protein VKO39_14175 [Cyanobacteriota bacterium]|nr:hypothetical protein [Cyanobacteriota bacterium]
MTLAFQSLLMVVLLVSGAVAVVPVVLRDFPPQAPTAAPARWGASRLWIVETPQGRWLINGVPRTPNDLERLMRRQSPLQRVHYLPSDALPLVRVSRSLRLLRGWTPAAVVLELPPGDRRRSP